MLMCVSINTYISHVYEMFPIIHIYRIYIYIYIYIYIREYIYERERERARELYING